MSKAPQFDLSDADDGLNETNSPHVVWCASCDGPTELNDEGRCSTCTDNGETGIDIALVVPEPVPPTSPRSIECSTCGADPGAYCYEGEDGAGYNHAQRVEEHEAEHEVIAARPVRR